MTSSYKRIYKSGSPVEVEDYCLRQIHTPETMRELLKLKKVEARQLEQKVEKEESGARLERIEKKAYDKGFLEGEKACIKTGTGKASLIIERVEAMATEIANFKEAYYKKHEEEVVGIIIAATEKVVHSELKVNKEVVMKILRSAIDALILTENIQVNMNPDDIEYLRANNPGFLENLEKDRGFNVTPSPEISTGGVLVESKHAEIDARIEEGLIKVSNAIRGAIKHESETD